MNRIWRLWIIADKDVEWRESTPAIFISVSLSCFPRCRGNDSAIKKFLQDSLLVEPAFDAGLFRLMTPQVKW
jgi:hypothetical protein